MTLLRSRPIVLLAAVVAVLTGLLFWAGSPTAADAHPLGNFTVNRYSRIEAYRDVIRIHYVLDLAEIPAFQATNDIDGDADGAISAGEARAYGVITTRELATNVDLAVDGSPVRLEAVASRAVVAKGQAGLDIIRVDAVFEATTPPGFADIEYRDRNYAGRLGWKEIVVASVPGLILEGSPPSRDVTGGLTSYPDDLISSPLDITTTAFSIDATGAVVAPRLVLPAIESLNAVSRDGAGLASLIDSENMTLTVVLVALLAAFGFGALHALEPGHGKTLVAAYFVGVKGSAKQALLLGLIIAATHTIGVMAIGLVALFGSQFILPETLYPWLSLASGLMVLGLGVRLVAMRGGGRVLHLLAHLVPWKHNHDHARDGSQSSPGAPPWRSLVALGLADGLTPSPSAVIVLLAAVSLGRIGLGIGLIVAFSAGLSAVLAAVSLGLVYTRRIAERLQGHGFGSRIPMLGPVAGPANGEGTLARMMPLGAACVLVVVGFVLTLRALSGAGIAL